MDGQSFLTVAEVAKRRGVSRRTVLRLIERGVIPVAVQAPGSRGAFLIDPEALDNLDGAA